jgi:hypothetical protein
MTRIVRYSIFMISIGSLCMSQPTRTDLLDDYLNEESTADFLDQDFFGDTDPYNEYFPPSTIAKQLPPEIIIQFLLGLNALQILQSDFYIHTNPLNKRSMLDSPLFEFHNFNLEDTWLVQGTAFFNKTHRCNFTAKSDNISSYLALSSPTLIGAIVSLFENVNALIPNFSDIDVPTVFSLFQRISVEERNLGLMISGIRRWERAYFQIMAPLLYHERNFFLTLDELDDLADQLGESEPDFQQKHVVSDKFGLGDTRLEFGVTLVEKPAIECIVGFEATIPTAFVMAKNFYGSSFPALDSYPNIDWNILYNALEGYLNNTITLREQNEVIALTRYFLLGTIDRLAANILDDPLGNGGHLGTGIFIYTQSPIDCLLNHTGWDGHLWWHNRASIEYLWSKKQNRSYIHQNNPQDFADRNFNDTDMAAENLIFLQNEIIYRTNLLALKTNVLPGPILRWTSSFDYDGISWSSRFGANLWVQPSEHLAGKRVGPCSTTTTNQVLALDMCKIHLPLAMQIKLFGELNYTFNEQGIAWTLGVNGDITALKRGIGRDYTIGFLFEASF